MGNLARLAAREPFGNLEQRPVKLVIRSDVSGSDGRIRVGDGCDSAFVTDSSFCRKSSETGKDCKALRPVWLGFGRERNKRNGISGNERLYRFYRCRIGLQSGFIGIRKKAAGKNRVEHSRPRTDGKEEKRRLGNVLQSLEKRVGSLKIESVGIENHHRFPIGALSGQRGLRDNRAYVFDGIRRVAPLLSFSKHFLGLFLAHGVLSEFYRRLEGDDFRQGRLEKLLPRRDAETGNLRDRVERGIIRTDYRRNGNGVEVSGDGFFEFWGHLQTGAYSV